MSQRRIAVVIAGMLVGAQVGIAAVGGSIPTTEEYAEPAPARAEGAEQLAAEAPAGAEAPAVAEASAEPAQVGERAPAPEVGYVVPRPRTLADATFPPLHSDVFPPSTDDRPLLPSLIAYLDRRAASIDLASAGAPEPIFPSSDEGWQMSPTQMAYFDRLEAERVAAAEARAQALAGVAVEPAVAAQPQPMEEKAPGAVGAVEGISTPGSGS